MTARWIQAELAIRDDSLDEPSPVEAVRAALRREDDSSRRRSGSPYTMESGPDGKRRRVYLTAEEIRRLRRREQRLGTLAGHLPPPGLGGDTLNFGQAVEVAWQEEFPIVRQGVRIFALRGDQAVVHEGDTARVYRLGREVT